MKYLYHIFCTVVLVCFLTACAPARLTVRVDLYRFTESNRAAVNQLAQIQALQIDTRQLENDIHAMLVHYRIVRTNLLKAELTGAQTLTNASKEKIAENARMKVYQSLMASSQKFDQEIQAEFTAINKDLNTWLQLVESMQADNQTALRDAEKCRQAVIKRLTGINQRMQNELSDQKSGDDTERMLSLNGLRDELNKLKKQYTSTNSQATTELISDLGRAEEALLATENYEAKTLRRSEQAIDRAGNSPAESINPELSADDSDPFYQIIANPRFRPGWSTNFFIQHAKADGNVSFLIVRETPVRFTVSEAKANPAVLIKSQLRSARAGIKTVAAVAKAVNPTLALVSSKAADGTIGGETEKVPITVATIRQKEEQVGILLGRMDQKITTFEEKLEVQKDTLKPAEQALSDKQTAVEKLAELVVKSDGAVKAAQAAVDADPANDSKKNALIQRQAELKKLHQEKIEAEQQAAVAQSELNSKREAVDKWAKQWFETDVRPALEGYGANLSNIIGQTN